MKRSTGNELFSWLYNLLNIAPPKRDLALQDKCIGIRLTTSIGHRATTAVGMLLDTSLSTIRPVNLFCKLTKGHFYSLLDLHVYPYFCS